MPRRAMTAASTVVEADLQKAASNHHEPGYDARLCYE
jgi:hypothetical protein